MFFVPVPKNTQQGDGNQMEKVRNSSLLKILCYIIIPILAAILGLSIFHIAFLNEFGNAEEETEYSQTENFANNYLYFFIGKIADCQNVEENTYNFIELEDAQGNNYYYSNNQDSYNYRNGIGAYINYVIIDKETREDVYQYKKQQLPRSNG